MTTERFSRRRFVQSVAAGIAIASATDVLAQASGASGSGVPMRSLGRTGVRVSVIAVGGGHANRLQDGEEYVRYAHTAVDEGINFFDNAWCYGDGNAETKMGRALAADGYRKKVFLMTKNCGRDYEHSIKCLEDSLRRLHTDYVDLWQFHEVNWDNDPDWIFERGPMRAALEARKAGKVRFIGFTGHKDPRIHLKMLGKPFEWDACMMPLNVMDAHYRSFQNEVLPVCLKRKIGVIGFKSFGGGDGVFVARANVTPEECLRYSLSLPVSTQVLGMISLDQLKQNLAIARNFKPMEKVEKAQLLERVKEVAGDGRYEGFKSMMIHDAAIHRQQHGFPLK